MSEWLYGISEWWLALVILVVLYASAELGYRLGFSASARILEHGFSNVATIEGALLGLLGLLLGFAFAMAMNRFDNRKNVMMEEANDIQTTWLRAQLLPGKQRGEALQLLQQYLDSRIGFYQMSNKPAETRQAMETATRLQAQLWDVAVAAAQENSDRVRTGLFVQSLNDVIDDHTKRVTAMDNHVPETILVLLIVTSALTLGVTGYSCGLKKTRLLGLWAVLVLAITITLVVVIDLDRPRRGLIRVSENALTGLKTDLANWPGQSSR